MIVLFFSLLSLSTFSAEIVLEVPNTQKKIALTFDACATKRKLPQYDKKITEILVKTNTPATIFLSGRWIEQKESHVTDLAFNPLFELGNHSWDHPHFKTLNEKQIKNQIEKTQEALFRATGKVGKYFRPPYGEYNKKVLNVAKSLGLTTIEYSLPSGDPDINITRKKLIDWVVKKTKSGSIIVMHINKKGIITANALPEIIYQLKKKGFKFVTISELIESAKKQNLASSKRPILPR